MRQILSIKDPAQIIVVSFGFAAVLAVGETLASPVVSVSVDSGTDAAPGALLSGVPVIVGPDIQQKVIGGLAGVDYAIKCQADTSTGLRHISVATLPVRNK